MAKLKSLDQLKAEFASGEATLTLVGGAASHEGYHQFPSDLEDEDGHGSFQVFHHSAADSEPPQYTTGWYWWACFSGCLPDGGEPSGPFATSKEAYDNAMGGE